LEDIEGLIRTCEQQGIQSPTELEATARAFRLGVARSPWAGAEIQAAIEKAKEQLSHRVRGQPEAMSAVYTALLKAQTGLSGAHQSGMSRGPRATLFFAGPTGTGKTEAAKAIAELVYGDESALVRFDCAEFRQDHSVARLIGAPPGYVGFESGGELTDRIRSRPHSVLLFDELEKAHPRLLDIFLSILDDGRLTNGQGVTTNFSETILIFTSNLGIYEEIPGDKGNIVRRPRFDFNAAYEEIQSSVRNAIREEFISTLGRPELLGRLGGERALIVFDYLRDLSGVAEKFVNNIRAAMKRLHDIDLNVDASVIHFIAADTAARPDALVLGARGMVQSLDALFTDPLAIFISGNKARNCQILAIVDDGVIKLSVK
jgi:ATP-dependent Clp protease ATP-binding subunit ClpA